MTQFNGPWRAVRGGECIADRDGMFVANVMQGQSSSRTPDTDDRARLIAAAPEMLAALGNVQKLISEAASTGFNWKDGDWAERLFASQQVTSRAIKAATGHSIFSRHQDSEAR